MIDKIAFLFVEGIKNFTRNKLANFICIITILINFTILGTFFVFGYNTDNIVNFFRSKYTFEVFLNSDTNGYILSFLELHSVFTRSKNLFIILPFLFDNFLKT